MTNKVSLNEYIHQEMDILYLALNAPERSNRNESWFSGSKSFWNLLYRAGLITEHINKPIGADEIVFGCQTINYNNAIYGVTDLNRRDVETDSSKVKLINSDIERVINILNTTKTKVLCLLHSKVSSDLEKKNLINKNPPYGKVGNYNKTVIYKMPFHNASIPDKHIYYRQLLKEFHRN